MKKRKKEINYIIIIKYIWFIDYVECEVKGVKLFKFILDKMRMKLKIFITSNKTKQKKKNSNQNEERMWR